MLAALDDRYGIDHIKAELPYPTFEKYVLHRHAGIHQSDEQISHILFPKHYGDLRLLGTMLGSVEVG